ncbi:MAG: heavy metal translocating P-type ATPase, partial [Candidatus Omnitrophota bacterium]
AITKRKTSQAIRRLWGLRPKTALVIQQGREIEARLEDLMVGDLIAIKPGGRIPVDGEIIEGYSSVDESVITGESIPVEKNAGDAVIAGSINKHGAFTFRAQKVGRETTLAQIIKLVEDAQMSKAPIQELADKVASIFVPVVLVVAFLAFFFWILAGKSFIFALTVFITVLIIACPCSLGLAVPTAVMAGTGRAAERGIIIKNAKSLQIARQIKTIIFDKTGTLTIGKPKVSDVFGYAGSEDEILKLCASLENKSEHPLAEAVVEAANAKGISLTEVEAFEAVPGKGLIGKIAGGNLLLGSRRLMEEKGVNLQSVDEGIKKLEIQGKTLMFLAKDGKLAGLIAVRDTLKEFSKAAIDGLKKMGKQVIMLTGDNQRTAQAIAGEVGIARVLSEVLPQDKQDEIKKLQSSGNKVAFV